MPGHKGVRRVLSGGRPVTKNCMTSSWLLIAVPGTCVLLASILYLSAMAEQRFMSARSLILGVVRARGNTPEFAEKFVARQFERLLREEAAR